LSCEIDGCHKEKISKFCSRHELAKENIEKEFSKWQIAFGSSYTMVEYLTELIENEDLNSGMWVKDIAEYILETKNDEN